MSRPLLLAFGDSLTAGYGLPAAEAFPAQLEAALRATRPGARVLNAGVSGDTSASGLLRLPRVLSGLSARPDLVLVELGANDLLRGMAPAATRANLRAILRLLGDARLPALVLGVTAPPLGPWATAYNALFPAVAAEAGAAFHPVPLAGVVGNPALTLPDRVHPNGRAVAIAVDAMLPAVARALAEAAPAAA